MGGVYTVPEDESAVIGHFVGRFAGVGCGVEERGNERGGFETLAD